MKSFLVFLIALSAFAKVDVLFSPEDGDKAFERIFNEISNAKDYAYITVYSWKLTELEDSIKEACKNGAKVKVVLSSRHEQSKSKAIEELDKMDCVDIKIPSKTMHEKFVIVDDRFAMNSSGNFSSGARDSYNESTVFYELDKLADKDEENEKNKDEKSIINALKQEFALLFNYSKNSKFDSGDGSEKLDHFKRDKNNKIINLPDEDIISLYSSSMNFKLSEKAKPLSNGSILGLSSKKNSYIVADMIVDKMDNAKSSILMSVNYVLLDRICEALERAIDRDVEVKIINDNKSVKDRNDCTVRLKNKLKQNGRYKFYSFFPTSRKAVLNHNKTILIDYNDKAKEPISDNTLLISGSHNLSENAERKQFDNQILYTTKEYSNLYRAFYKDIMKVFNLNRDSHDRPDQDIIDYLLSDRKGYYKIHNRDLSKIISLSYKELQELREDIERLAPGILDRSTPKEFLEECDYYKASNKKYYNYSRGKFTLCEISKKVSLREGNFTVVMKGANDPRAFFSCDRYDSKLQEYQSRDLDKETDSTQEVEAQIMLFETKHEQAMIKFERPSRENKSIIQRQIQELDKKITSLKEEHSQLKNKKFYKACTVEVESENAVITYKGSTMNEMRYIAK